jgi:hypothetical protein
MAQQRHDLTQIANIKKYERGPHVLELKKHAETGADKCNGTPSLQQCPTYKNSSSHDS